jgi:hypothetical protein
MRSNRAWVTVGGHGHGVGVLVETRDAEVGVGVEEGAGVGGAPERGVDDGPGRHRAEEVDDLVGHHRAVLEGLGRHGVALSSSEAATPTGNLRPTAAPGMSPRVAKRKRAE